ncbi:hypothetical protein LSTR_LSTR001972 [Laodelphax striatellus]|uniref:Uncharacterized protein n=1 Tax=Laodelphax striatellus TaxID=195883 RepID=A0A482XI76_LAOST|nr:hypothetical protein LSTR_LSTR001972 [Laodelphax striatellus]
MHRKTDQWKNGNPVKGCEICSEAGILRFDFIYDACEPYVEVEKGDSGSVGVTKETPFSNLALFIIYLASSMLAAGVDTGGKSLRSLNRLFLLLTIAILNLALSASVEATSSCRSGNRWPVEKRARHAELVFHALAVENYPAIDVENPPEKGFRYTAQFWLISVYKGDQQLAKYLNLEETLTNGIYDIHDRRVNVTRFYRPNATATPNCWKPVTSQKYYVIFAEMRDDHLAAKDDDTLGAYADWTEKNEQKAWRGVGWEQWSEWAACSASCGEGSQIRSRYCLLQDGCRGFNREKRTCNTFPCEGSVSPLDVDESKFFHPSRAQWTRVPGRETAWRLRPNSYLWLPAAQLPFPPANFRRHFAILVTLRLDPKEINVSSQDQYEKKEIRSRFRSPERVFRRQI